ncbi:hypothetical protein CW751_03145 [Brumimicrobium salinarum]|uniref:AlgX/AlgJ SGNH hydrolase-like domain-containing protein n=1 Tax=Brumimicrobium salinarum TaxID=2058658 RepID=A0A2I0R4P2_9FLAO|nr:hypothetical protein [Brumimicrobium salinarum]PKR81537.1 hypothetical protein CW751_03145 [Brumimicrobium salinarum]
MKKNKLIKYQLPILFLILIMAPFILSFLKIEGFQRKDENRAFKDNVSLKINQLDRFPTDFNAYFSDNFFFRSPLLNIYHQTKFYIFNTSPHPNKTLIGRDGWNFKGGIELEILGGRKNFTEKQLTEFTNEWKRRKDYFDKKEIPIFWVIAPMKHQIYDQQLPYSIQASQKNRIHNLKKHLDKSLPGLLIYPDKVLKKQKDNHKLYFQLDNHWNQRAGSIVSEIIIEKVRKHFPNQNIPSATALKWKKDTLQEGYHYNVLGIPELYEISESIMPNSYHSTTTEKFGFTPVPGFAYPWEYERRYKNDRIENGVRILFIRDSFGAALIPFIRESFAESLFIFDAWQFKVNEEIVEQYKPDVVVFIGLETNPENTLKKYGN